MKTRLAVFCLLAVLAAPSAARAETAGFWPEGGSWEVHGAGQRLAIDERSLVPRGEKCLALTVEGGREGWVKATGDFDWRGSAALSLQVLVPPEAGEPVKMVFYLKDQDWLWFETGVFTIEPGRARSIRISLADDAALNPVGHLRGWDAYRLRHVREAGFRFFFARPGRGSVFLHAFRLEPAAPAREIRLLNYRAGPERVARYDRYEAAFEISEVFDNPFDPDSVRVDGVFTAPSGREMTVPAFFYHDYLRYLGPSGEENYAYGRSEWRLRFAPVETGRHRCRIEVALPDGRRSFQGGEFDADEPTGPGFVRWDRDDPAWLAFDDGGFFYPIGHTLRSPDDEREQYRYEFPVEKGLGTFAYDRYLPRMSRHGENFARVWMAAWWAGLEWTPAYAYHYGGLGDYSQENAWKLDHVVELARAESVYLILTMINHGQFSIRPDAEWWDNPLNVVNGGFLASPDDFFTDERAADYFRKRLRYIVARWGYSTSIAFWELWNEVDLTGYYDTAKVRDWHREMIPYLKSLDPWGHIATTHYCRQNMDPQVWAIPELETISGNAYNRAVIDNMRDFYLQRKPFSKPILINEFGSGRNRASLENNLHAGIWASSMMPMTGTALFWWWPFIDHYDLYERYRVLADFWRGEDRRGRELQLSDAAVVFSPGTKAGPVAAVGIQNQSSGYFWVYDHGFLQAQDPPADLPGHEGLRLAVSHLLPGSYRVEFRDTRTGTLLGAEIFAAGGEEPAVIALPGFRSDLALKVKPAVDPVP